MFIQIAYFFLYRCAARLKWDQISIYCVEHGGGALCQEEGCTTTAFGDGKGGKAIHCKSSYR